jgi:hypothetical protein
MLSEPEVVVALPVPYCDFRAASALAALWVVFTLLVVVFFSVVSVVSVLEDTRVPVEEVPLVVFDVPVPVADAVVDAVASWFFSS